LSRRLTEERSMPTFDGGHYFLTALAPIRTGVVQDDLAETSPIHALRKRLDLLATAEQTQACQGQSPFARNTRNHFARLVIIDDVAYNGRVERDTVLATLSGDNLVVAQPQDHLSRPFLLFVVDFDARSGDASERDSYLAELWNTMGRELRDIFTFCESFDQRVKDAAGFAKYIANCQIETTMSFNDYYIDPLNLPSWPVTPFKRAGIAAAGVLAAGLVLSLLNWVFNIAPHTGFWLTLFGLVALALVVAAAYRSVTLAGEKPFPAAPDSDLPTVLKSLHLQRVFPRFAIDNQMLSVATDSASVQKLYDNFAAFIDDNKPDDLNAPTQSPGVIGI
jgi:hypothetical protein